MECPLIDRGTPPNPRFNTPINYYDLGGVDYIFYDHDDGFGKVTRVQFCSLIGRKRDVFQCLNESEWRECPYYLTSLRASPPAAQDSPRILAYSPTSQREAGPEWA